MDFTEQHREEHRDEGGPRPLPLHSAAPTGCFQILLVKPGYVVAWPEADHSAVAAINQALLLCQASYEA